MFTLCRIRDSYCIMLENKLLHYTNDDTISMNWTFENCSELKEIMKMQFVTSNNPKLKFIKLCEFKNYTDLENNYPEMFV